MLTLEDLEQIEKNAARGMVPTGAETADLVALARSGLLSLSVQTDEAAQRRREQLLEEARPLQIAELRLAEGDVVVVKTSAYMTQAMALTLKAMVEASLLAAGRSAPVLVLTGDLRVEVLKSSELPKTE